MAIHEDAREEAVFLDEMGERGWVFLGAVPSSDPQVPSRWVFRRPIIQGAP